MNLEQAAAASIRFTEGFGIDLNGGLADATLEGTHLVLEGEAQPAMTIFTVPPMTRVTYTDNKTFKVAIPLFGGQREEFLPIIEAGPHRIEAEFRQIGEHGAWYVTDMAPLDEVGPNGDIVAGCLK